MAVCDVQTLLTDGRCFHGLSPGLLSAANVALWCDVSDIIANALSNNPALQSIDDGLWYRLTPIETSPGRAILNVGQIPVDPGDNAELVLTDLDDGLNYVFQLYGVPPNVFWQILTTPTGNPATPTTLFAGSDGFILSTVESGSTIDLSPAP